MFFCSTVGSITCRSQEAWSRNVISGVVADSMGAKVKDAAVHIQAGAGDAAGVRDTRTDATGSFSVHLPPGSYQVTISVPGFTPFVRSVDLKPDGHVSLFATLSVATHTEEISVPEADNASTAAEAGSMVLEGNALDTLSRDDATFQQQVLAMAPSFGQAGQIFVDGFSGARFPPRNTIRSVRINQNSFSAAYDSFGFSRIDIDTKPGTDRLHGSVDTSGTTHLFDTGDRYTNLQPPFYVLKFSGTLSGPIDKETSFLLASTVNDLQNNAAVNAIVLNSTNQQEALNQAVPDPQLQSTYSARLDRQWTPANTLTARYEFNQLNITNGGVGLLALQEDGYNSGTTTQTLQLSDQQVIGSKMIDTARFQYLRTRLNQGPVVTANIHYSCIACTYIVEGAFIGGPNPSQVLHDNQDRYEVQDDLSLERKAHFFRFGGRFRSLRDANLSRADYNGEYIYNSLADYPNQPSQYSITSGNPSATALTDDLAVYAEDSWKATSSFTLNYGLRLESQTAIPDHFDPAPRLSVLWALRRKKAKTPFLTLRSGAGFFYDRFAATNILTAIRQNGMTQTTVITLDPTLTSTPQPPTTYKISPNLHTQYEFFTSFSVLHSFGSKGSASVNYILTRGVHQYLSRNINAPLPGTFLYGEPSSGVRPLGGLQNIYEFDSNGILKDQDFYFNLRLRPTKTLSLYSSYLIQHDYGDSSGATVFPSNQYNVGQDYGPSTNSHGQEFFLGGSQQLPFGIRSDVYFSALSGAPFDITLGTDLNGDTQFNDRPSFATAASPAASVFHTAYGTFDLNPQPGEKIIPHNYGKGPDFVYLQLAATRECALGGRRATVTAPGAAKAGPPLAAAPYHLSFGVEADNLPNRVNSGQPIGVLSSPYFGKPISLNTIFSPNTAASRVVYLRTSFNF